MKTNSSHPSVTSEIDKPIMADLQANLQYIKETIGNSSDLVVKVFLGLREWPAALVYMAGLVDQHILHSSILRSLVQHPDRDLEEIEDNRRLDYLMHEVLIAADIEKITEMTEIFTDLMGGNVILLLDGSCIALRIGAAGWEDRNVTEPNSQSVVRGPMEGFNENLRTNITLIRRRIKDPRLWVETREIGYISKTTVAMVYLNHVADDGVVQEVRNRLEKIDIDAILDSGYIEEFIQDASKTVFPTVYNSERPDTVCAALLEGRVAILVDGTPFVLLVPALFAHFFQSAEDYYQRADISTLLRLIRYLSFFIAMLAPSFYIAISTFHQEMLPTNLLISLAAQREGVPFPAFIEAMLMELTYEILREAGVRIPKTVGQAVSIVGTLVIGQAAVDAGVVSAAMVIIVSITAISSYVIPENGLAISVRIIRFLMMGLAATFGFYGILIGLIMLTIHLTSLRSFGVAYMSPFGPLIASDLKDTLYRAPWPFMRARPVSSKAQNLRRQSKKGVRKGVEKRDRI
ncbi:spore germination protein [Paenibacillus sp. GCM10012307]|uniref:Spore germination protein n=1 Tax=Paenibacillus roseus TaxID=2798579 RepID=A0A934J0L7_9BACL|nr:spore germination protein [Paenibacillus roseus]MBJ6360540.1 spore germination protein [Paenibacillus roseus]